MKNVARQLTTAEYERNFAEITPAYTPAQASLEAARCLYCYDAPRNPSFYY